MTRLSSPESLPDFQRPGPYQKSLSSGVFPAGPNVKQHLFADYVRSATRRQMFVQTLGTSNHEVVRAEERLMLRAKEKLQAHIRELGDRLSTGDREVLLRHLSMARPTWRLRRESWAGISSDRFARSGIERWAGEHERQEWDEGEGFDEPIHSRCGFVRCQAGASHHASSCRVVPGRSRPGPRQALRAWRALGG